MRTKLLAAVVFALSPVMGFASEGVTRTDLASLKAKCSELLQNQQLKPFTTKITCREVRYSWKPAENFVSNRLKNQREVGGSILMKSYEVPYAGSQVPAKDTPVNCPVFEKWKESVAAVDIELSCEQLQEVQDLTQLCSPVIEERVKQDPSIISAEKTEETFNVCSGLAR